MNALGHKCIYCGLPIPETCRSDRKYCPEKNGIVDFCKNKTHNPNTQAAYHDTKGLKKINIKNRDILRDLLGDLKAKQVTEQELLLKGFKLEFIINKGVRPSNKNGVFLYLTYGLECINKGVFEIFKHAERY